MTLKKRIVLNQKISLHISKKRKIESESNKVKPKLISFYKENVFRSSHQRHSIQKGVLKNSAKFTGKHLCQSLFFDKVAGLRQKIGAVNGKLRKSITKINHFVCYCMVL